jgi:hypothetical protein
MYAEKGGNNLCLDACTMRDTILVEFMSGAEGVEGVVRMAHGVNMVGENTFLVGELVGIGTEALSAVEVVEEGVRSLRWMKATEVGEEQTGTPMNMPGMLAAAGAARKHAVLTQGWGMQDPEE